MRVLIFSTTYFPFIGGAEIAVKEITDRVKSYQFDLITARLSKKNLKTEKIGNVNVYRVGLGCKLDKYFLPILGCLKAKELNKKYHYSLIWSISASQAGLAALFFKMKNSQIPFLLTVQEGSSKKRMFKRRWMVWPLVKKIFKKADYIQAISKFLADFSKEMGAKCPIKVIPNGVDVEKYGLPRIEETTDNHGLNENGLPRIEETTDNYGLKKKLGIKENKRVIITVSRLVPKNGVGDLIKSLKYIDLPIKLLIIGVGPLGKKLKKLVKKLKIQDRVLFLGLVPPDEVPKYLAISDVFVRPSISEGFGNVFVEAMAVGVPIIGTPVGGIPDFLIDYNANDANNNANDANVNANYANYSCAADNSCGRIRVPDPDVHRGRLRYSHAANGLFCQPKNPKDLAEKIKQLLNNDNLRIQLGKNGRKLVEEKYDWGIIVKDIMQIIQTLCR